MATIHVVPVHDILAHEDLIQCWCCPRVERDMDGQCIVIHNSADGREHFEANAPTLKRSEMH